MKSICETRQAASRRVFDDVGEKSIKEMEINNKKTKENIVYEARVSTRRPQGAGKNMSGPAPTGLPMLQ